MEKSANAGGLRAPADNSMVLLGLPALFPGPV